MCFAIFLGWGCSSNPTPLSSSSPNASPTTDPQALLSQTLLGGRMSFNYSDAYSLAYPNPSTGCSGDFRAYYDPILLNSAGTPQSFAINDTDSSTTIRPAFILNASVDLTNTGGLNSTGNIVGQCTFSTIPFSGSPTISTVSACATYDFGSAAGISSTLGGTILFLGGLQSANATPLTAACGVTYPAGSPQTNTCSSALYALGLQVATPSISTTGASIASQVVPSTWLDVPVATTTVGPQGLAGQATAYNPSISSLISFGGSATFPASTTATNPSGSVTQDTWIYDIQGQTWNHQTVDGQVNLGMLRTYDVGPPIPVPSPQVPANPEPAVPVPAPTCTPIPTTGVVCETSYQMPKNSQARALFGYASVPGIGMSQLSADGLFHLSNVDTTDRIVIVGGVGSGCAGGVCNDTHRFNPSYGPEYFDLKATTGADIPVTYAGAISPAQWIESYPMQLMSNNYNSSSIADSSIYNHTNFPDLGATGIAAVINAAVTSMLRTSGTASSVGLGYLVGAGGFYGDSTSFSELNTPLGATCLNQNQCGQLKIQLKTNDPGALTNVSDMTSVTNFRDSAGYSASPAIWKNATAQAGDSTPWYGGASMVPGLRADLNDVVYFGGATCKSYLTDVGEACPNWIPTTGIGNPGLYLRFGADPTAHFTTIYSSSIPYSNTAGHGTINNVAYTGPMTTPPQYAGMASARGEDPSGNPLIVSVGGMLAAGGVNNTGNIFYMYSNTTTNQPTWAIYNPGTSATRPAGLGNAALVYSHVTQKFYLFGGYNPIFGSSPNSSSVGTTGDTWELSVTTPSCGAGTSASCQFSWRILNQSAGLQCYPSCPQARRSHSMVEVNYNNLAVTTGYTNAADPGQPVCSSSAPCSFGIFMEGGSPDGALLFSDRWMFDPSANNGAGLWQLMGELPPRTLGALASVDYAVSSTNQILHRAVLFGGETGLQNPNIKTASNPAFVAPTLGDTWMFDLTGNTWNRVNLYGQRFNSAVSGVSAVVDRSADLIPTSSTVFYSPPPLSGAIMVTRTKSNTVTANSPLLIPEVFLIGGRKKDGTYSTLNNVYKFCAGSTGEKPWPSTTLLGVATNVTGALNDATCDANSTTNPLSPNPTVTFVGRWLYKNPSALDTNGINPATRGLFMGAGTYDTIHDLVIVMGGLVPPTSSPSLPVTQSATPSNEVWEYTPPSMVLPKGTAPPASGSLFNAIQGTWELVPTCAGSAAPPARYGHTLSFDEVHGTLVVVGGYNSSATLLQQVQTAQTTAFASPEVWTGVRSNPSAGQTLCYTWTQQFGNQTAPLATSQTPPTAGLALSGGVYIPPTGFSTGYYSLFDNACIGEGPIVSSDPAITRQLAGGAYFDIDRTQIGPNENLLLNLTFFALGNGMQGPGQTLLTVTDNPVLRIHLIKTGQSGDALRTVNQPRYLSYSNTTAFPEVDQSIAVFAPSPGQIQQEQIYIPLSASPSVDRIRIERFEGSAILIDASLFRLSQH